MGELDDGSPFVAIGKLQKQIEQILESKLMGFFVIFAR